MSEKFADAIHAEIMKRLKKTVNSKKARLSVRLYGAGFIGQWQNLEITGRAVLSGFEEHWSFDFTFRNCEAASILDNCKLEVPERPSAKSATGSVKKTEGV